MNFASTYDCCWRGDIKIVLKLSFSVLAMRERNSRVNSRTYDGISSTFLNIMWTSGYPVTQLRCVTVSVCVDGWGCGGGGKTKKGGRAPEIKAALSSYFILSFHFNLRTKQDRKCTEAPGWDLVGLKHYFWPLLWHLPCLPLAP